MSPRAQDFLTAPDPDLKRNAEPTPLSPAPALILCQYFWPEEMATAVMVSGVALRAAAEDAPILVIAGQPAYWPGANDARANLPREMRNGHTRVIRVWSTRLNKNRTLGRALNTATFTLSAAWAALRCERPRMILAVTNPPTLPWVAALTGRLRRIPYTLLIHDVYPRIATALGRLKPGSWIVRLWGALNRRAYRGAGRIIALGDCMARVLREEIGAAPAPRIEIIQNWADKTLIKPVPRVGHPALESWGLSGFFTAQYSGNIGLFHDFDTILDAARILQRRALVERDADAARVRFILIGDGAQAGRVNLALGENQLHNLRSLPFQPAGALPMTLTACDAGLVTLKPEATGLCVPSKLYGIMAAGRAVICVADPATETARTVIDADCGVVIQPGDAVALADTLTRMSQDPAWVERMGQAARRRFEERFSLDVIAERYAEVLRG